MIKPFTSSAVLRPAASLNLIILPTVRSAPRARSYATQNSLGTTAPQSKRRTVTPFNDDGHVPWNQLSAAEKTARATQQSFNFGMIIAGVVLTVRDPGGLYLLLAYIVHSGWRYLCPLDRRLFSGQQDGRVQPRG
jgi:hypothetical protein